MQQNYRETDISRKLLPSTVQLDNYLDWECMT